MAAHRVSRQLPTQEAIEWYISRVGIKVHIVYDRAHDIVGVYANEDTAYNLVPSGGAVAVHFMEA